MIAGGQVALTVEHGWLGGDGSVLRVQLLALKVLTMMMVKKSQVLPLGSAGNGCCSLTDTSLCSSRRRWLRFSAGDACSSSAGTPWKQSLRSSVSSGTCRLSCCLSCGLQRQLEACYRRASHLDSNALAVLYASPCL